MTLNVPINLQGVPLALNSEQFLLWRKNIEFEVKIDNLGKKELKGKVQITSILGISDQSQNYTSQRQAISRFHIIRYPNSNTIPIISRISYIRKYIFEGFDKPKSELVARDVSFQIVV